MSRSQQNKRNQNNAAHAWGMLIGFAFTVHVLFFGFIFFSCRDTLDFFELTLSHKSLHSSPVFFTPLPQKEVSQPVYTSITDKEVGLLAQSIEEKIVEQQEKKELIDDQPLVAEEHKIVENKKEIVEEVEDRAIAQSVSAEATTRQGATAEDEPEMIKDQKQLHAERDLYQIIAQQWHPPLGVTIESDCIVIGVINNDGIIEITNLQSSGVLILTLRCVVRYKRLYYHNLHVEKH